MGCSNTHRREDKMDQQAITITTQNLCLVCMLIIVHCPNNNIIWLEEVEQFFLDIQRPSDWNSENMNMNRKLS